MYVHRLLPSISIVVTNVAKMQPITVLGYFHFFSFRYDGESRQKILSQYSCVIS